MSFKHIRCALFSGLLVLAGCGSGGGIGGTGASTGTLKLALTDAPACGYDAVNITVERIRVHQSANAADGDSGWQELVLTPARRVDLLTLNNGVLEELGQTTLPAGRYTQLRLVLAPNDATAPLENSVVPTGGAETALDTPSATQSGLKLNVDIDVPAGQVADLVLDFDACKSVVRRGNSGRYNLKPVIAVIPRVGDPGLRVIGYVDPAIAVGTTSISVQAAGVPVKSTPPDAAGRFLLYPVPAGTYDLVVTSAGHVTAVMTGVPVTTAAPTQVNTLAIPISPPTAPSAPRIVSGTVTPVEATVRALQALTAGPTIEVAWAPVDAVTGEFEFRLVIEAPVKTAYVPTPVALTFVADATAAGKYTIEAASGGVKKLQPVNAAAAVPPITFTFP